MVGVTERHSRLWCRSADMVYILVDGGYSAWMALGLCIRQNRNLNLVFIECFWHVLSTQPECTGYLLTASD